MTLYYCRNDVLITSDTSVENIRASQEEFIERKISFIYIDTTYAKFSRMHIYATTSWQAPRRITIEEISM
jgi:hypothetical protein